MNKPAIAGKVAAAVAGLILLAVTVSIFAADRDDFPVALFTQQDAVQAFDLTTGNGYQTGTVTGVIAGTSYVEFAFAPTGPPAGDVLPLAFQNKVVLTDLDGDQIFFDNNGTGTLHLGIPGLPFRGLGGPMTGTYVVTGGTGKYQHWTVGTTFKSNTIFTNPPSPANILGTVYVKISRDRKHHWLPPHGEPES